MRSKKESEKIIWKEFQKWADTYFAQDNLNRFVPLRDALTDLRENTSFKIWNYPYLKEWLEKWASYNGHVFNPKESRNRHGDCHDPLSKGSGEMFVIKGTPKKKLSEAEIISLCLHLGLLRWPVRFTF